jgi:hypothetical protein
MAPPTDFHIQMSNSTSVSSSGSTGRSSIPETPAIEPRRLWNTGCTAFAKHDGGEDVTQHSRGMIYPSFANHRAPEIGGRRECRVPGAPAASCAVKKAHEFETEGTPNSPAFPARWVTAYPALSPVSGLIATVARKIAPANLTSASGGQDHTALPSAQVRSSPAPKRPSHPAPHVRDDRDPPLLAGPGCAHTIIYF